MEEVKSVRITTIVDNDVWRKKFTSSWGLPLFVETVSEEKRYAVSARAKPKPLKLEKDPSNYVASLFYA